MTDPTPASAPSGNRTVMIVLAYLGLLALIPFLVEKNDKEVQWHAKHGLVLLVAEVAFFIVFSIILMILGSIPVLGCFAAGVGTLLWFVVVIGILVIHIMCIVKGVNGQRFTLPYVSEYADKF
jgi:uncharacterized membrane protein